MASRVPPSDIPALSPRSGGTASVLSEVALFRTVQPVVNPFSFTDFYLVHLLPCSLYRVIPGLFPVGTVAQETRAENFSADTEPVC